MFWKKWFEPRPFNVGYLNVGNGHQVFFMEFGNPKGKPILCFHGGPGGSAKPYNTGFADLKKFRVVLFDQRGCGKSLPSGEIENNTTQDALEDAKFLLNHLKINEKVIVRGGSWGSTLALLFAQKNPQKVDKLLLSQIFLADKNARDWEFDGNRNFYPDFVNDLKSRAGKKDIKSFYNEEIQSNSVKKQLDAINYYGFFERVCGNLLPQWGKCSEIDEKELAGQRIYMHYAANNFMLKDSEIMDNIAKIRHIPAVIVHNRLDFVCPFRGAYDLHLALPKSRLVVVPERGHVGKLLSKTIKKEFRKELENDR